MAMTTLHHKQKPKLIRKAVMSFFCGAITSVQTTKPVVALTFDDGPDAADTPKILDLLDYHDVKATFFVLGKRAQQHPEIIQRMARSGHAIGNHGWSHLSMPTLSWNERCREIKKTQTVLAPYGSRLFRPAFGHMDWQTHRDVLSCGFRSVAWDIVGRDWTDRTDAQILATIESRLKPGSIVLLHDSLFTFQRMEHRNRGPMLAALDRLIHKIHERFSFLTVPELLKTGRPNRARWLKRGDDEWLKSQKYLDDNRLSAARPPYGSSGYSRNSHDHTGKISSEKACRPMLGKAV
jgi:peptidoglycan-N-acetylglucosamine deacetylase